MTFTFTDFGNYGTNKYDKYLQIQGDDDESYSIKWSVESGCEITVTGIECKVGRAWLGDGRILVNGTDIGKLPGWNTNTVSKSDLSLGNNDSILFRATRDANIYYIKMTYTITPNAPTPHDANLDATLSLEEKKTLDVTIGTGSLFTMSSPAEDFEYTYRLKEDYANAHLEDGLFWATETGDYDIQARVASADDHEASAWSTSTVHVTRVCVFNDSIGNKDWQTARNWLHHAIPSGEGTDSMRVMSNLTIDEQVQVRGLYIGDAAKVEIAPTGGLTVGAGGISGATSGNNLFLRASNTGKTGYLRISPDCTKAMPNATVELFSIAYADNSSQTATWQYVGSPLATNIGGWDVCTYGQQFIYGWSESTGNWFDAYGAEIEPFKGYCLTQNNNENGKKFTFTGQLAAPETKEISLSYAGAGDNKGYHVLANSFTAPIDISLMDAGDFVNASATIYIFNTGTYNEEGYTVVSDGNSTTAGQYIAVTPGTAASIYASDATYPIMIPAMQGFCVQATEASAKLKLDYEKVVWAANYGSHANQPMRVPSRKTEAQETNEPNVTDFIKVTLSDGEAGDNLYLLASEEYDKSYENGFDAPKMMSDDPALPNIFAAENDGQFAIDATSDIEGTFIGVRTGKASNYTLYFSHVNGETKWELLDLQTNQKTMIADEASYSFSATPNSLITNRFLIVESEENVGTATGTDELTIQNKVQKFIYNNQLLILKDGVLYDARGMVVSR